MLLCSFFFSCTMSNNKNYYYYYSFQQMADPKFESSTFTAIVITITATTSFQTLHFSVLVCLLVSGAAVYCCLIPQGVTSEGKITTNKDDIKMYLYLGNYGYSMWLCWIASGIFLLASGMAFEGSNQQNRAKRNKRLIDA